MEMGKQELIKEEIALPQGLSMDEFHEKSHFWGRLTMSMVIILSLLLPLYLSFVSGYHPGWQPIITAFVAYAAMVGYTWVIEPISYYPTLGVSGTYLSFLTGNISTMCLPAAAAAQNVIGAEPGTKKGEITASLAMGAASLVNIFILSIIIAFGSFLISLIPPSFQTSFQFIVPAIFGGVLAQFAFHKPINGIVALAVGIIINILPIVSFAKGIICIVITVVICIYLEKLKIQKEKF
ncbi:small-conductance mechanosensitive channel [Domibacillus epiphyticus]|uniref:Small-conductance mechanosensitive channel n=1 Tax=Domibacillus epiphyticus TaxID=1714355 RepID=A0A1V2A661_9BACI|nr:small-conductance mechanosensitive channel [Domibacillus epiphyticus]OMP66304.1 small-conductance mechanosensitive channel [Domibacillus epiphyticus]